MRQYLIKGNYYFDIDFFNQLRLTGPGNHLFLGITFPMEVDPQITEYDLEDGILTIKVNLNVRNLTIALPLVTDIRTLRSYTERAKTHPTYAQLVKQKKDILLPQHATYHSVDGVSQIRLLSSYKDEENVSRQYGCQLIFPKAGTVKLSDREILVKSQNPIQFIIKTISNIEIKDPWLDPLFLPKAARSFEGLPKKIQNIYHTSGTFIEHLVRAKKTSSFEYGTIFPRDWIESADLGDGDLTPGTIDYMYQQSLLFVNESGEGWHENSVGQYKSRSKNDREEIDRKMIDIEPRYILGINRVSRPFLLNNDNRQKLKRIGDYILKLAQENDLITFKKMNTKKSEYYVVGNWRDSVQAFPRQKSPVAPYDVNCVFYPLTIKQFIKYKDFFDYDENLLNKLYAKWQTQKDKFRMFHPCSIIGYSLALHGLKQRPLPVAHLDEAYDLFYGEPSMEEVISFARKIVDPNYFYTPVGPMLVASDEEDFSTQQYHGKVIWPKQAAYAIAGLALQFHRGLQHSWPSPALHTIHEAAQQTCLACFKGWSDLGAVPELYYYDSQSDKAKFYTDQQNYEGQMSVIQLWSSVGMRRIVRDYLSLSMHRPV